MSPSEEDPQFAVELLEKVVVKNDELKSELREGLQIGIVIE